MKWIHSLTTRIKHSSQFVFNPFEYLMKSPPKLRPLLNSNSRKERHALLINPFYPKDPHASFGKHVLTPTLALTSIAASTPENWTVEYWDENLLQGSPPIEPFPHVVGITVHLTFAERAYELADYYRKGGAIVVMGGLHLLACREEAEKHADILAIGEGVRVWPKILDDIQSGLWQPSYTGSFRDQYNQEPAPARKILPRKSFLTTSSLIATRGCHNRCGFCYLATDNLHMPYQMRDADQIADEFAKDNQPYGVFLDNNLGSKPDYLKDLCQALKPLEKIWSAAVSIDITDHPSVVREMALAGCTGVFVGFESLNDANIADAGKKSPKADDYARRVEMFHRFGIQVNGSFVLGFDHDEPDVFQKTVEWIEKVRLECATFHILTPYPGTPLFRQMESEGRIIHRNWNLYDTANVVFHPKRMTIDQLSKGYSYSYKRLFKLRSIWRRRPYDFRAIFPYLAMSLLYKRSNRVWPLIIKTRLVSTFWRPLIELSRIRHVRFRDRLAQIPITDQETTVSKSGTLLPASV